MAFDRSKFKAASTASNKKISDQLDQTMKTPNKRGDYHSIDKGINLFRMFPPHKEGDPSMQPKVVTWLEVNVPETDKEGNAVKGKFEWKKRPIFDSRIHGGTDKDIINEYITFTKNTIYNDVTDRDEVKKLLAPINGYRITKGKDSGKWVPGILPSSKFVMYATKGDITTSNIGRLELYKKDKEELEKLNIDEETGDVIQTDIFSDPDEGVQFIVNYRENNDGKMENVITKKSPSKGVSWEEFETSQKIPDSVLEAYGEMEPLSKQFNNVYKRSDFTKAIEGLRRFDEEHEYNTFSNDEFLDIVEEIDAYYPEDDITETKEESKSKTVDLDEMTRTELKEYIKENNLSIKVAPSMKEDTIRELILIAEDESEEEEAEEEEEVEVKKTPATKKDKVVDDLPFDVEEKKPASSAKVNDIKTRLANLKNRSK